MGAFVAALVVLLSNDPQQEILATTAAIVLAGYAAADLYFWPRLSVTGEGLTLRTPTVRATVAWADDPIVRVDGRRHLGLTSHTLEIDAGELLVVLGRHGLGADPAEVLGLVESFRPRDRPRDRHPDPPRDQD